MCGGGGGIAELLPATVAQRGHKTWRAKATTTKAKKPNHLQCTTSNYLERLSRWGGPLYRPPREGRASFETQHAQRRQKEGRSRPPCKIVICQRAQPSATPPPRPLCISQGVLRMACSTVHVMRAQQRQEFPPRRAFERIKNPFSHFLSWVARKQGGQGAREGTRKRCRVHLPPPKGLTADVSGILYMHPPHTRNPPKMLRCPNESDFSIHTLPLRLYVVGATLHALPCIFTQRCPEGN